MAIKPHLFRSVCARLRASFCVSESLPIEGECAICLAGHSDIRRLAQIIGKLPCGQAINWGKVRRGLDASFKTVIADVEYLVSELRLPIEISKGGILLKEPISLCRDHARIAEQQASRSGNSPAMRRAWHVTEAGRDYDSVTPPL